MKNEMGAISRWLLLMMIGLFAVSAFAETSSTDEKQAKQAVPSTGKALLYVYRRQDGGNRSVAVLLNGNEVTKLSPLTFGLWNVNSGRIDIRVESKVLALEAEAGRIYFVELSHSPAAVTLKQVSYAEGRQQTFQARLASAVPESETRVPAPKPAPAPAPAPAPSAPKAPAKTPAPTKPVRRATPTPVHKNSDLKDWTLSLKLGSVSLNSDSQQILGANRNFDAAASSMDVELEKFLNDNVSIGGEYVQYSNDFTTETTLTEGEIATKLYLGTARFYFGDAGARWRGYVGAGAGLATTEFSGALTGGTTGVAFAFTGGVQWRWDEFGLRAEYKLLRATTEDDNGEEADVSAGGFFVGANLYF